MLRSPRRRPPSNLCRSSDLLDQRWRDTRSVLTSSLTCGTVSNRLVEMGGGGMTHDDYVDTNRPTAKGADRYGYDGWGKQASTTWDGLERLQSLFERTTPSYT